MLSLKSKLRLRLLSQSQPGRALAEVVPAYRNLSPQEYAVARWLLDHADSPCTAYRNQLDVARVAGGCTCGCPTVRIFIPPGTPAAEPRAPLLPSAAGMVEGRRVSVTLLQSGGYLTCLYVRDLDPIARPYGLPRLESLGTDARYESLLTASPALGQGNTPYLLQAGPSAR